MLNLTIKQLFTILFNSQDSWDAEEEEIKKPETKVPEKKTKSKLEQKIAEREVSYLFHYCCFIYSL